MVKYFGQHSGLVLLLFSQILLAHIKIARSQGVINHGEGNTRPCMIDNNCLCYSVWDSDCVCDGSDEPGTTQCDCANLCADLWRYENKTVKDFYNGPCDSPYQGKMTEVILFVESKCPTGLQLVDSMKPVLEVLGEYIHMTVNFIVERDLDRPWGFKSIHGDTEVEGDLWELCAMSLYPQYKDYVPFLSCLNNKYKILPQNVPECIRITSMSYNDVKDCVNGEKGKDLMGSSVYETKTWKAQSCPTLFIGGKEYTGEISTTALVKEMCYSFSHPYSPIPIWAWIIGAAILFVGLVIIGIAIYRKCIGYLGENSLEEGYQAVPQGSEDETELQGVTTDIVLTDDELESDAEEIDFSEKKQIDKQLDDREQGREE